MGAESKTLGTLNSRYYEELFDVYEQTPRLFGTGKSRNYGELFDVCEQSPSRFGIGNSWNYEELCMCGNRAIGSWYREFRELEE